MSDDRRKGNPDTEVTHAYNALGQPIGLSLSNWTPPPFPQRAPMEGRYCKLEPIDPARHAEHLYSANALDAEGRNWTYLPYGPFETFGNYRAWLETECLGGDPLFFAILDKASGKPLGVAAYLRISPEAGCIEVGHIHYSEGMKRSPMATEAMYLMMCKAFELGYRRYEWKCDVLNAPSRAAAQRLGFSFEGVFRQATVYKKRNRDTAWYAVIDSDWPGLRDAFLKWLDPSNFDGQGRQRARLTDLTRPILAQQG